jgi:hypothetical protein
MHESRIPSYELATIWFHESLTLMKKSLFIILLAACISMLSAQNQTVSANPDLQKELQSLNSTIKALRHTQAVQRRTFNILASRVDSLRVAVKATQIAAQSTQMLASQTADSVTLLSKTQSLHTQSIDTLDAALNMRTTLIILALVALGALSLVIFFTLKRAIGDAVQLLEMQIARPSSAETRKYEAKAVSPLVVETPQKKTSMTLPIEPELFEPPASKHHVAIAEMMSPKESGAESPAVQTERATKPHAKAAAHCQGVTKSGSRCKRKPISGTHFCAQHTK